ncbi:hypothetical protein [Paraliomyxa miuraensis]|uniref:hypothetical protein n=1 Tax=Paraliomyxa miuraensis TaxID=376150 RepID=UPI00225B5AF1|nr:hypothetical protein [Paraliomyxa miuraensis]MCX4240663.1 hypothetical protein [Paraliomyxa miuraensis]
MKRRTFLGGRRSLCLVAGLSAMTATCMTPGQYKIYRVAQAEADQSSGCYPSDPGVDVTGDSTTFRTGLTFAIFAADSDTFFMDIAGVSLEGTQNGSEYSFKGNSVDVMTIAADTTLTVTTDTVVDVEIKGAKISGSAETTITQECSGPGCPMPANSQCITTQDFLGAEVKGAELEYPL